MGTAIERERSTVRGGPAPEEPAWQLVERHFGFEVRAYPSSVLARTTVRGGYRENLGDAFRVLTSYLFGGNRAADGSSVSIELTAPVWHVDRGTVSVVSLRMPSAWTLARLPRPLDARVALVPVPAARQAVLGFVGRATPEEVAARKEELRQLVASAGLQEAGEVALAQYDPPWALSPGRRNEVLIPVA